MPDKMMAWEPEGIPFDPSTWEQAHKIAAFPFVRAVRLMPDAHVGIGATVGSVIATKGAVVPGSVGVDIGCGVGCQRISLKGKDLPDNLRPIRDLLERTIPVGFEAHDRIPSSVSHAWDRLSSRFEKIAQADSKIPKGNEANQLGTMGGGNHFLELCLDLEDNVYLLLHSGSRGVGNRIGQFYITAAQKDCEKNGVKVTHGTGWLTENTQLFKDYLEAVQWAQDYAMLNRKLMMSRALVALHNSGLVPTFTLTGSEVSCHHNYISHEVHFGEELIVTRKGAVSARLGEIGIIPGSMGAKTYIVEGLGNLDSLTSCSHGAGRVYSRGRAKELFSVADLEKSTKGVECRKDQGVLDEIPGAYKDIDAVMEAQKELVRPIYQLKQVLCIKG